MSTQENGNNSENPFGEEVDNSDEFGGDVLIPEGNNATPESDSRRAQLALVGKKDGNRSDQIRREHKSIVARARALHKAGFMNLPDFKPVVKGGAPMFEILNTDSNRFKVLDELFGFDRERFNKEEDALTEEERENRAALMTEHGYTMGAAQCVARPHLDRFSGLLVDHEGRHISKEEYPVVRWVEVFRAAGMKGLSAESVRKTLREWAREHSWDSIVEHMLDVTPDWDGVPRMRRALIEMFDCADTPLSEAVSQAFFLQLWNRVMHEGCNAPLSLCLFGHQHSGKSFWQKKICRMVTGNEKADTARLNFALTPQIQKDFLRNVTGRTVIASGSELTGFRHAEMSAVKDFTDRDSDPVDNKWEAVILKPRQWVICVDSNEYAAIQRDRTGNRRFAMIFVGQLADSEDGQPRWNTTKGYKAPFLSDLKKFESDFWQIMAECAAWIEERGQDGYQRFIDEVSKMVSAFNQYEMDNGRGTSKNPVLDSYFMPVLRDVLNCTDKETFGLKHTRYYDGTAYEKGVMVSTALFGELYLKSAGEKVQFSALESLAQMHGAKVQKAKANKLYLIFPQFESVEAMREKLDTDNALDRVEVVRRADDSAGF